MFDSAAKLSMNYVIIHAIIIPTVTQSNGFTIQAAVINEEQIESILVMSGQGAIDVGLYVIVIAAAMVARVAVVGVEEAAAVGMECDEEAGAIVVEMPKYSVATALEPKSAIAAKMEATTAMMAVITTTVVKMVFEVRSESCHIVEGSTAFAIDATTTIVFAVIELFKYATATTKHAAKQTKWPPSANYAAQSIVNQF